MANTHLEHLEDDILNNGSAGGKNAVAFLRELGQMLTEPSSNIRITTKWDGAPAVVCGQHPATGNFFVGTKSVFNKTAPKICLSDSDIDEWYNGELAHKLKTCLKLLPQLGIKGVLQGDLLYTNDLGSKTINGEQCVSFTPNTITYAVPAKTPLAKKIKASKMGIVFHTTYSGGPAVRDMTASFGANVAPFQGNKNVTVFSSDFSDVTGASVMTSSEKAKYLAAVNKTEGSLKQASSFLDILGGKNDGRFLFSALFKQYFNSFIRGGKKIQNVQVVATGFTKFYTDLLDKEIASKKQEATKKKYQKIKADGLKFLKVNYRAIYMTVASYMNLIAAKSMVIKQLQKVKGIGTYIKTDTGFKVTAPEGFVAIKSGSALKLVDRLEFSRVNFNIEKNWG